MVLNPKVDNYFIEGCGRCSLVGTPQCKVHNWQVEMQHLRMILNDCGLTEDLKWSMPCYTFQGKNVVMLAAFREYCSINFFKGALLKDEQGILVKQGENSQVTRLFKATDIQTVIENELHIKAYILEAIEIEKSGQKVELKDNTMLDLPEELLEKFKEMPTFQTAFEALTPGRQRGYQIHFSQPKQSQTRTARIEKYRAQIMVGKGFYD